MQSYLLGKPINNIEIYCQKHGSAIGQKHSPPVACLGAGIAERRFLNIPRDIIFEDIHCQANPPF